MKYPIGQISNGEAVYNKGGLASSLGYSKSECDSDVTAKVERIRKQLGTDEDTESYAVEKNTDMIDNEEIVAEYPDMLEMEEKSFELTMNQKKEIISIALSELDNDVCSTRYWICDLDDAYVYVQDSKNDYRTYRIRYILNQENKTAEICLDTMEEAINGGYEVVGQEGEDSVNEEFKNEETLAEEKVLEEEKTMEEEKRSIKKK